MTELVLIDQPAARGLKCVRVDSLQLMDRYKECYDLIVKVNEIMENYGHTIPYLHLWGCGVRFTWIGSSKQMLRIFLSASKPHFTYVMEDRKGKFAENTVYGDNMAAVLLVLSNWLKEDFCNGK